MRHRSTAIVLAAVLAAAGGLAAAGDARAQSPTADQMIRALRPTAPSNTGRGIRALDSGAAPATPVAPTMPSPSYGGGGGGAPAARTTMATPPPPVRPAAPPALNLTVNFTSGSAELTPDAVRTLDQLGQALTSSALSGYRFRIEGHTDTVGTPASNKALSDMRAAKVVEYLSTKFGVDRSKVEAVGMGQEQLLVPTGPNVPQARNRRVTVVNLGA